MISTTPWGQPRWIRGNLLMCRDLAVNSHVIFFLSRRLCASWLNPKLNYQWLGNLYTSFFQCLQGSHGPRKFLSVTYSEFLDERNYSILWRQILYLRGKTTTENTNWAVSVYDERLYFCKNAQTTLKCSVVTLALLSSDASGHLNELNLNNSVSSLTRRVFSWKLAPMLGVEQLRAVWSF